MSDQLAFDFNENGPSSGVGLEAWRANRRQAIETLAEKQGMPLGQRVRVEFENGPPLEGTLLLMEEVLFAPTRKDAHLHLRIGDADFHADEIISCIRLQ